ncbi:hypothetical protein ACBJ59_36635 [Nonomuraea sp. MTCD27]|uniref:hypothetical protein n=1 Tax=Nonomuraea sp. MTCD27 TaxID=1676747 RepID=UPI0035C24638
MRLNTSAAILSAVALAATLTVAGAASATADVPGLSIVKVGYNAYGADTVWNRNQEFVDVRASVATDVKGLVVTDQWGKSNLDDNDRGCNTYKVSGALPGIPEVDGKVTLPAGHTLRVYSGRGTAAHSGTVHAVFMDSRCGYHGHIWGNGGDTAWVVKGDASGSFAFDFDNGYTVKP